MGSCFPGSSEGQITDFFSYTSLEITREITYKNHKITKKSHTEAPKITENLLKNHTKKSLKGTKIAKKPQEKIM